ncbi:MAG: hypothetical protein HY821_12280 [Acidobacteria bacterium]|nr:hypothetical protein [Acidobacteriota bacterium]
MIVRRTQSAAAILRTACAAGHIRFDLEPREFLLSGSVSEKKVDCDRP